MGTPETTFALFFGNRGFFPSELMREAREELPRALKGLGYDYLMMDEDATRYGAVETVEEGERFASFLNENRGKYQGIILSLPNFGDETGAVAALKEADVPILIQAYPDDLDKMGPAVRRDSFCGKFSVMDVFYQYGLKFTALKPHTVHPMSERFTENLEYFGALCRVVDGVRGMTVGAIGARTTAFKTVRIDEVALQRQGITMETIDLSHVFNRMTDITQDAAYKDAKVRLEGLASWEGVPEEAKDKIVKLGLVIEQLIEEYALDAFALRCWIELQEQLGISPCILMGDFNQRGIPAACEVDVGNAVAMHALRLASQAPAMCLDWNNNYGDDDEKCILFHCGPIPPSLMKGKGRITDHAILANAVGEGRGYGCNVGLIAPGEFTFASMMTHEGKPRFYLGQGEFTGDPIPEDFFGCAGVARIDNLQGVLLHVGKHGYRHHVSATPGRHAAPVAEALDYYLDMSAALPQGVRE
jgi:L-fucose isomerase-like protein